MHMPVTFSVYSRTRVIKQPSSYHSGYIVGDDDNLLMIPVIIYAWQDHTGKIDLCVQLMHKIKSSSHLLPQHSSGEPNKVQLWH